MLDEETTQIVSEQSSSPPTPSRLESVVSDVTGGKRKRDHKDKGKKVLKAKKTKQSCLKVIKSERLEVSIGSLAKILLLLLKQVVFHPLLAWMLNSTSLHKDHLLGYYR